MVVVAAKVKTRRGPQILNWEYVPFFPCAQHGSLPFPYAVPCARHLSITSCTLQMPAHE